MKGRIIKTVKILAAYIMLNVGALSWIEVSAATENKMNSVQMTMAEIKTDSENNLEISVLGKSAVFDFSFIELKEVQTVIFAFVDPLILAAWETVLQI